MSTSTSVVASCLMSFLSSFAVAWIVAEVVCPAVSSVLICVWVAEVGCGLGIVFVGVVCDSGEVLIEVVSMLGIVGSRVSGCV